MKLVFAVVVLVSASASAFAQGSCYPGFHQACKQRSQQCTYERVCDGQECRGVRKCAALSTPVTDCYCTKENE